MRGNWPEIPRRELDFGRFHVEHVPTGDFYSRVAGEVSEESKNVAAFYIAADGEPVFLERPAGGPMTRREFEERRRGRAT